MDSQTAVRLSSGKSKLWPLSILLIALPQCPKLRQVRHPTRSPQWPAQQT